MLFSFILDRMPHTYITLSQWICNPNLNYYHLFFNCIIHIVSYMKKHTLTKNNTYFVIDSSIHKKAYPFFKEILSLFVNITELNNMIKPITINIAEYNDRNILYNTLQTFQLPMSQHKKIVYVKRKGKRYVLNDDDCIKALEQQYKNKYDVVVARFESLSFKKQIELMSECILLIGCHGAGFTNVYFMNSGSSLFELFPESFYIGCFKKICDEKSIKHFYMNGTSSKRPAITLDHYMKNMHCPTFNNAKLRCSIRDITFTIDVKEFTKKLSSILQ